MRIINYNTHKLRIIENSNNIFFLSKSGLTVSAYLGSIVFNTSDNKSFTYKFSDIEEPPSNNLDALVVIIRGYIDNV